MVLAEHDWQTVKAHAKHLCLARRNANPPQSDRGDLRIRPAGYRFSQQGFLVNGAFYAPGNIGDGRRDALFASLTAPMDRLGVRGGLFRIFNTWRWSRVTDPGTLRSRRISFEQPSFLQFRFSQDLPKHNAVWGNDGNLRFQDRSYRINEVRSNVKRDFYIL